MKVEVRGLEQLSAIQGMVINWPRMLEQALVQGHKQTVLLLTRNLTNRAEELGLIDTANYVRNMATGAADEIAKIIKAGFSGLGTEGEIRSVVENLMEYADPLELRKSDFYKHPLFKRGYKVYAHVLRDSFDDIIRIFQKQISIALKRAF